MNSGRDLQGLSRLRLGFILVSLAEIMLFSSFIVILNAVFESISKVSNTSSLPSFNATSLASTIISSISGSLLLVTTLEGIGIITGIIASIFLYIGFSKGKGIYRVGSATTGAILVLIAFIVYFLSSVIGLILGIIGFILIKGALDSISDTYNEDLVRSGAVLNIIPILSIIGALITAFGINKIINKIRGGQIGLQISQQVNISQSSLPIQQVGLGVIREDGEISLSLYSQVSGTITSLKIEGTPYSVMTSVPLVIGSNNVTINLGTKVNLVKASIYKVTLIISIPSGTIPLTVDAIFNP